MPRRFPAGGLAALHGEVEVDAPVETVWALVSDLRAMGRRSPETVRMFIAGAPTVGTRGVNVNRKGLIVWPTTTRITRWKPPSGGAGPRAATGTQHDGAAALAFHVAPTNVEWSYELIPVGSGTRLIERRAPVPQAGLAVRVVSRWLLGGAEGHDVELADGIERTLAAIKAEAEAEALSS